MATQPARDDNKTCTMTIPQLLTPEEPLQHSFERSAPKTSLPVSVLSPPTSPEFSSFSTETRFQQSDDVLYPDDINNESYKPLFEHTRSATPECQQSPSTERSLSVSTPPSSHAVSVQHDTVTTLRPEAIESRTESSRGYIHPVEAYNRDPKGYYNQCLAQLDSIRLAKNAHPQRTLPAPVRSRVPTRDRNTQDQVSSLGRPVRIDKNTRTAAQTSKTKATPTAASLAKPATIDASPAMSKNESQTKRRRRQTTTPDASFGLFPGAAAPKARTRAPPTKAIDNKDNSEWDDIVDRSPPISSLDKMDKRLEANWHNNNKINLDNDPNRGYLHPQELEVAATLRLKCDAYLANKRRIFAAKLQALQDHKEFNKTSAQTCTNIDVNKASRLWDTFNRVGWFDEHWFSAWLS